MIPGNADPRRSDKIQRYKAPNSGNGTAPGEDLTPDYMNILGPESTSGNADGDTKPSESIKSADINGSKQQQSQQKEEVSKSEIGVTVTYTTNTTNVIPTSPQYGVAIIPTTTTTASLPNETIITTTSNNPTEALKTIETEIKDMNSTPSKNDRFKVVKIASAEPFRRGRWKCMDYVDQAPPVSSQSKTSQASASVPISGNVYMQTQSLPPHQIQQLLVQGGFASAVPQFFQGNVPSQVLPQAQYFYQANVQPQSLPQHIINATMLPPNAAIPPQFISTGQQHFFQPAVIATGSVPPNFQGIQFVQQPLAPNQNSAFVPTTQNLQIPQTYGSQTTQPNNTQSYTGSIQEAVVTQAQPLVNGYAFSSQNEHPLSATQVAKNVILNTSTESNQGQNIVQSTDAQVNQNCTQPVAQNNMNQQFNESNTTNIAQQQQQQQQQQQPQQQQQQQPQQQSVTQAEVPTNVVQVTPNANIFTTTTVPQNQGIIIQATPAYDPNIPTSVYTNPQFVASVSSLPIVEPSDGQTASGSNEINSTAEGASDNSDDPAKTNPVVNAIDNKIEQAMDLVKSHLMYTVREEVEVLKEKIAELMERIQQLETENNFLRSQIPKNQNSTQNGSSSEPPPPATQ